MKNSENTCCTKIRPPPEQLKAVAENVSKLSQAEAGGVRDSVAPRHLAGGAQTRLRSRTPCRQFNLEKCLERCSETSWHRCRRHGTSPFTDAAWDHAVHAPPAGGADTGADNRPAASLPAGRVCVARMSARSTERGLGVTLGKYRTSYGFSFHLRMRRPAR